MNISKTGDAARTVLLAVVVSLVFWTIPGLAQFPAPSSVFGGKGGRGGVGRGGMRGLSRVPANGRNRPVNTKGRNAEFINQGVDEDPENIHSLDRPFATVKGTVLGEQGKPVKGVQVLIVRLDQKAEFKIYSDHKGRVSYTGLAAGDYMIGVVYKGVLGNVRYPTLRNGDDYQGVFDLTEFDAMDNLRTINTGLLGPDDDQVDSQLKVSNKLLERYNKAKAAAAKGDYATALAILQELVVEDSNQVVFWHRLAEIHMLLKQYPDAGNAFRKAMDLKPAVAYYPLMTSLTLLFLDKLDQAQPLVEKTAALDKETGAQAYYNFGQALTDNGDLDKAERAFTKATELDGSFSGAFLELGLNLMRHDSNLQAAKQPLERFIAMEKGNSAAAADVQAAQELIAEIDKPRISGGVR